ncbi:hypothetical protein E2C01_093069 [Portunus trituberculatus]|uniref:Uncharacterized protein n=1 Tax=Portunus trituberculatus TaxID=210409 RepID=A0A5B7JLV5_PORTR|nr:hypothetical protein [Portunus trituberculatus]
MYEYALSIDILYSLLPLNDADKNCVKKKKKETIKCFGTVPHEPFASNPADVLRLTASFSLSLLSAIVEVSVSSEDRVIWAGKIAGIT